MATRMGNPYSVPPVPGRRQFASDNYAGICPEAWLAMEQANAGHAPAYGNDQWTAAVSEMVREIFETKCEVFFVFNGTAANSLALASLCQSYHSVICHELAHVETDECGAPEFFSNGTKVLTVPGPEGKVTPNAVKQTVERRSDLHFPKPRAVSLTQATELGTVYTADEVKAVWAVAKSHNLRIHMDGARFANAVASLGVKPKEITWQAGVDVLCFGGTKNGAGVGDMVVFFDGKLADEFEYRCKQAGQLASKMRYLSAPWLGLLKDSNWLKLATKANQMAALLETELRKIPAVKILNTRQANAVFAELPEKTIDALWRRGWLFYTFIGKGGCRLMCSWDTQESDITAFIKDLKAVQQEETEATERK